MQLKKKFKREELNLFRQRIPFDYLKVFKTANSSLFPSLLCFCIQVCLFKIYIYICLFYRYIDHYTCMNDKESTYIVRDASKSFPSGHSSISVYGSISLAVSMINFKNNYTYSNISRIKLIYRRFKYNYLIRFRIILLWIKGKLNIYIFLFYLKSNLTQNK